MKDKYQLITPTRKELNLLNYKNVVNFFNKNKFEAIVNCVDGFKPFCNIRNFPGKIIQFGSGAEYDKSRSIVNFNESNWGLPPDSTDKYAISKYLISLNAYSYQNIFIFRPFGVFGKYEDVHRRFISKAIIQKLKKKSITIYQNVKFSYIWVSDLVQIVNWFIQNDPKYKFYNVGGYQLTLEEIAKKVGVKYKIDKPGMGNEYTCDDSRLRKETKIKYTSFKKSIKELEKYYANL